ncbi:MAG: flippase-like domain-containing protein [Gammaproteobacteria bacterium]|nr:MAG: flippase-like domain-containing protein [Gammaproteobacteria bacterium]
MNRSLRIVVSVTLLALVIRLADWRATAEVLKTVDGGWVALAVALAAADRLILNYRWQVLLAARGVLVGFMRLLRVQLAANFLGSFLPSSMGVDAVRIAALCRAGEPTALVVAATLVDRVSIGVATLLSGSLTILVLAQERIPPHIVRMVLGSTLLVAVAGAAALHTGIRRRVRSALLSRVPQRLRFALARIADASLAFRRDGSALARVTGSTLVLFAIRILFTRSLGLACGVDLPIADLVLILPILWIVVMLPITIGALGVQDAGYVALMALVGVSAPVAVGISLLEHLIVRAVSLPGAFMIEGMTAKSIRPQQ